MTAAGDKIALKPRTTDKTEDPTSTAGKHGSTTASKTNSTAAPAAGSSSHRRAAPAKLTEAERAERLAQMQANAEWRDEDRRRVVGAYRAADAREQQQQAETFDPDFANKAMQLAMKTQRSVESRLRANKNNIQRSAAAMDENFVKR